MKYLSLTIPGYGQIDAPAGVPTGGFTDSATGNSIIGWALNLVFVIAVVLVLFLIIWGGVQWMTSGGDKEKLSAARNRIIYAIIGLVIIFLSVLFLNLIFYFFGIDSFTQVQTSEAGSACQNSGIDFNTCLSTCSGFVGTELGDCINSLRNQ